jgi:uncharacterized membrane protein
MASRPEQSTSRLEGFSDGVFAVAATLLVLGLHASAPPGRLGHALGHEWPHYATYVVSFLTIGIIWMNHHAQFERIAHADRTLMILNLVLLMFVTLIPFPTSLLASHFNNASDERVAAATYCAAMLAMSVAFFATYMWSTHAKLFGDWITETHVGYLLRRNLLGLSSYVAAIALAFVSPAVSLVICGLAAVYFALPGRRPA